MSANQLFFLVAITIFLVIAASRAGWAAAFISSYVITLGGLTTNLYVMDGAVGHSGIAHGAPTISFGDVLLLCSLIAIWVQGGRLGVGWLLAGFAFPALVLLLAVWGNTPEQWAGLQLYVTAIVSFGIGRWLSENLSEASAFVLSCACLFTCAVQFTITFAQWLGISLTPRALSTDTAAIIESQGRMVGLYQHPAFLGKTVFLLLCFLLPLASRSKGTTRTFAFLALTVGGFAALLTLSRANSVAIVSAVFLWSILRGGLNSALKILGVSAVTGALLLTYTGIFQELLLRQENSEGGPRPWLFATGMNQVANAPMVGTGPNFYNEVVGQYDSFAAAGLPVHNSFIFAIAELGIPLAVVFFSPLIITVGRAVSRTLRSKSIDAQAATLFAILPGLFVIGWSGWGLMHAAALPLWFMGFGYLASGNGGTSSGERYPVRHDIRTAVTSESPLRT